MNEKKSFIKKLINHFRENFPIQLINILVYLLDSFYFIPPNTTSISKTVLIVRTDLLGDFVIWKTALRILAQKFKNQNYKVVLIGNEVWVNLAEKLKFCDVIIPLNRKKYFKDFNYRKNFLNEVNKYHFEYLFQPAYSRDFAVADSITRNVNAKYKIAFRRKAEAEYFFWNLLSNRWYTRLIAPSEEDQFEFFRIKEFLNEVDVKIEKYSTDISSYFEKKQAERKYFVILPGANAFRRCLEPEKFAALITAIKNKTGWDCYLCGSKGEMKLGKKIQSLLKFTCTNIIGQTSLEELGSVLINSELVIGNETGTLHFASALNKKAVCILGGGHFGRFMPYNEDISANPLKPAAVYKKMECYNCNWRCIYTDKKNEIVPCISQLSAEYIIKEINPLLPILT